MGLAERLAWFLRRCVCSRVGADWWPWCPPRIVHLRQKHSSFSQTQNFSQIFKWRFQFCDIMCLTIDFVFIYQFCGSDQYFMTHDGNHRVKWSGFRQRGVRWPRKAHRHGCVTAVHMTGVVNAFWVRNLSISSVIWFWSFSTNFSRRPPLK